ncbi:isocitrate lyase/PEP mutase family protein [Chitinimonas lacunae]|uniref:Isocitrate lyase/phosphoenolpyruvate mutase family protein n=1 Tax=Chitinimonas lacunae TaxID=1963018 RepID=A0ABV8MT13_9NEIS
MSNSRLEAKIAQFRELHSKGQLLLNNCWDVMTAKIAESLGAKALATTSAGVSWSLGFSDGHFAKRDLVLQNAALIAAQTDLPVSIDMEDGFVSQGECKIVVMTALKEAGVAGVNIEDSHDGRSLPIEEAAARLKAFRETAASLSYPIFINARMDAVLLGESKGVDDLVQRANAYFAAGADCVFIPGLIDLAACKAVSARLNGPLNVMALPGGPSAKELFAAGVTRVSAGSFHAESAYGHILAQMRHFQESGSLQVNKESHLGYFDANALAGRGQA